MIVENNTIEQQHIEEMCEKMFHFEDQDMPFVHNLYNSLSALVTQDIKHLKFMINKFGDHFTTLIT
jgi:hypothetical protein